MRHKVTAADKVETLKISFDIVNEQVIQAAALVDDAARIFLLGKIKSADIFQVPAHRTNWNALLALANKNLAFDLATLQTLTDNAVDIDYCTQLMESRPEAPENLSYHVDVLLWDATRIRAIIGPTAAFLNAIKDQTAEPEKVRALARQIGESFDGFEDRQYLHKSEQLVKEQMDAIRARRDGKAIYSFGIPTLDIDVETKENRFIPGAAPKKITVITGLSGGGKSTVAANIALGLARQKRKVLYGAFEVEGGPTLELITCLSLGWSRSKVNLGQLNDDELDIFESKMRAIAEYVVFISNPFRKGKGKRARKRDEEAPSNDRNLDVIQGYIADSGCDVFIADLWRRILARRDPEDEEAAMERQQSMAQETNTHHILVHQQRLKDVETRPDKRPTREGMKGSGILVEVPDTILGVHRPGLFSKVPDNRLEVIVLKQRDGKWPMAVQFDFDPDKGLLENGLTIPYNASGQELPDAEGVPGAPTTLSKFNPAGGKGKNGYGQKTPYRHPGQS